MAYGKAKAKPKKKFNHHNKIVDGLFTAAFLAQIPWLFTSVLSNLEDQKTLAAAAAGGKSSTI